MGGGKDPPQPYSNPQATTQEQTQQNINAAAASQEASNVNQVTPFGSLTYTQSGTGPGGIPLYTSTSQLSPQMQAIVTALQGGVTGQLGAANYGSGTSASDAIGGYTSGLTKDALDKEVAYLNPFFTQQQENLDNQLRNQGIFPDNPAYQRSMNNLAQSQNQSVTGFLANIEPQMFSQAKSVYEEPLAVSSQLYNMLNPSFFTQSLVNPTGATVQPTDYASIVNAYNNYQMEAYKQQVAQQTAMQSGIFGAAGKVLGGLASTDAVGAAVAGMI